MKYFYLFFSIIFFHTAHSQERQSVVCYVLYVKGEIKKPTGQKIFTGDTIIANDLTALKKGLAALKFETPGAMINLFESTAGSFRMTEEGIMGSKGHEDFFLFFKHLLKIKGQSVSLSSRGDCKCVTPQSCFIPDTNLNNKVLLIDQLTFSANEVIQKVETAAYYLNYNGRKRILKVTDGIVQIKTSDLVFKDTSFTEGETPELVIGLYLKDGSGTSTDLVAKVRFNIVPDSVLTNYYKTLRQATGETDLIKLKQAFINDVYLYFGKPTECQIDSIINSIKE
jgi:hypothetical protein